MAENELKVVVELGSNLKDVIKSIIDSVNTNNAAFINLWRSEGIATDTDYIMTPGNQLKKALNIDINDILKTAISGNPGKDITIILGQ